MRSLPVSWAKRFGRALETYLALYQLIHKSWDFEGTLSKANFGGAWKKNGAVGIGVIVRDCMGELLPHLHNRVVFTCIGRFRTRLCRDMRIFDCVVASH